MLDGYYITLSHIHNCSVIQYQTPFGIASLPTDIKKQVFNIEGISLEKKILEPETDITILEPTQKGLKNYPYGININPQKVNDVVYLIGNPRLRGFSFREGKVVDEDDYGTISNNCFGVDINIIPGDSGTPVVDENYKLVGLAEWNIEHSLGYVEKINSFTGEIAKLKNAKTYKGKFSR